MNWRIDAKKLFEKLKEGGDIWQTYFFAAVTDPPRFSQTNFYQMLKNDLHWETFIFPLGQKTYRCKQCNCSWTSWTEKGVDVALATKMLTHAMDRAFDTAILVSGDKDYLETVRAVKGLGLRVEIVAFGRSLAHELAKESSIPVVYLDDLRGQIELLRAEPVVEELQGPNAEPEEDTRVPSS